MKRRIRVAVATMLMALLMLSSASSAFASQKGVVKTSSAAIYSKCSRSSKVIGSRRKGQTVTVTGFKGNWVRVSKNGKTGYMLKSTLRSASSKSVTSKSAKKTTKKTAKKKTVSTKKIQIQLYKRGYLSRRNVTGKRTNAYKKAIREFQMLNGLKVTGSANSNTVRKILSSSRKRPKVTKTTWSHSGLSSRFPRGSTATIVEKNTGIRLKIRRVGGTKHADVEPATKKDTAKLKKIYDGEFSWDSKGVVLIAKGKYYAAAINGMPHGKQISHSNNYEGQFCLHLAGSHTHGTDHVNWNHQNSIKAVYNYFH